MSAFYPHMSNGRICRYRFCHFIAKVGDAFVGKFDVFFTEYYVGFHLLRKLFAGIRSRVAPVEFVYAKQTKATQAAAPVENTRVVVEIQCIRRKFSGDQTENFRFVFTVIFASPTKLTVVDVSVYIHGKIFAVVYAQIASGVSVTEGTRFHGKTYAQFFYVFFKAFCNGKIFL